ncbi:uncharacterized protein LOC134623292 [Pelmatolapia mariae]|uniref:uncharacterized protein LOC134623292 n=1 Tax=Pelmatolapia mariae TaxID=158779 RepID=UPI002FE684DF
MHCDKFQDKEKVIDRKENRLQDDLNHKHRKGQRDTLNIQEISVTHSTDNDLCVETEITKERQTEKQEGKETVEKSSQGSSERCVKNNEGNTINEEHEDRRIKSDDTGVTQLNYQLFQMDNTEKADTQLLENVKSHKNADQANLEVNDNPAVHGHLNKQDVMNDGQKELMDFRPETDKQTDNKWVSLTADHKNNTDYQGSEGSGDSRKDTGEYGGGRQNVGNDYSSKSISVEADKVTTGQRNLLTRYDLFHGSQDTQTGSDRIQIIPKDNQMNEQRSISRFLNEPIEEEDVMGEASDPDVTHSAHKDVCVQTQRRSVRDHREDTKEADKYIQMSEITIENPDNSEAVKHVIMRLDGRGQKTAEKIISVTCTSQSVGGVQIQSKEQKNVRDTKHNQSEGNKITKDRLTEKQEGKETVEKSSQGSSERCVKNNEGNTINEEHEDRRIKSDDTGVTQLNYQLFQMDNTEKADTQLLENVKSHKNADQANLEVNDNPAVHGHLNKQDVMNDGQKELMDFRPETDKQTDNKWVSLTADHKNNTDYQGSEGSGDSRKDTGEYGGGRQNVGNDYSSKSISVEADKVTTGQRNLLTRYDLFHGSQDTQTGSDRIQIIPKDNQMNEQRSISRFLNEPIEEEDVMGEASDPDVKHSAHKDVCVQTQRRSVRDHREDTKEADKYIQMSEITIENPDNSEAVKHVIMRLDGRGQKTAEKIISVTCTSQSVGGVQIQSKEQKNVRDTKHNQSEGNKITKDRLTEKQEGKETVEKSSQGSSERCVKNNEGNTINEEHEDRRIKSDDTGVTQLNYQLFQMDNTEKADTQLLENVKSHKNADQANLEVNDNPAVHGHLNKQDVMNDGQKELMDFRPETDKQTDNKWVSLTADHKNNTDYQGSEGSGDSRKDTGEYGGGRQNVGNDYSSKSISVEADKVTTGQRNLLTRYDLFHGSQDTQTGSDRIQIIPKDNQMNEQRSISRFLNEPIEEEDVMGEASDPDVTHSAHKDVCVQTQRRSVRDHREDTKEADKYIQMSEITIENPDNSEAVKHVIMRLDGRGQKTAEKIISVTCTSQSVGGVQIQSKEQKNVRDTKHNQSEGNKITKDRLTEKQKVGRDENVELDYFQPKARIGAQRLTEGGRGSKKSNPIVKVIDEEHTEIDSACKDGSQRKIIIKKIVDETTEDMTKWIESQRNIRSSLNL